MRFEFIVDEHVKIKTFLKKHEVSKGLLAKIKFRGGQILVNGRPENAIYLLDIGDRLVIDIPAEEGFETLKPMDRPLDILFEDDHFLVLNKPFGIASIPSAIHSNTLANFVKGYYVKQGYENQQVHIVTRLDKDTSGVMLLPNMAMPMPAWISNCSLNRFRNAIMPWSRDLGSLILSERLLLRLRVMKIQLSPAR